ncbi:MULTISPECIES: helix-turn-helix domain-containing protein [Streptomyces]|uniref:Excisionase family DNA binding protein n=2 Tax=Streptomyces fulvorobeus TaxID=284028 RepID=A0A7Y9HCJ7_9ACTN|nr:helix-turn-helix domain-containing protein [Streptomyces fulvorobeus]NYE42017.1 excisionase family DNA binding protein [Streptomyces fulvorobeus]OKJ46952.1 excisionase [Streptomyces sp. CB02115]
MTAPRSAMPRLELLKNDENPQDFDLTLLAVTVEEAARRLSIGRTTMYGLIRDGAVQTVPFGRSRRVPVQALINYLNQHMQTSNNHAAA